MRQFLIVAVAILAVSGNARAEDESVVQQSAGSDWSLGAGIGFASTSSGSLGTMLLPSTGLGLGTLTPGVRTTPLASLFLERRLSRRWWLVGRGTLGYSSSSSATDPGTLQAYYSEGTSETQSASGSLSFGLRSVVGSWSRVELSAFALLGGGGGWTSVTTTSVSTATDGTKTSQKLLGEGTNWSVGATGGFVVDVFLLSSLGVRFSTSVLSVGYGEANGSVKKETPGPDDKPGSTKISGFDAGISLSPSLELRVLF